MRKQLLQDTYQYYVELASNETNEGLKAHYEKQMERLSDQLNKVA